MNDKEQRLNEEQVSDLNTRRKEALSKLPGWRGEVGSKNNIRSLPGTEVGQIFWVNMDSKAYIIAEKDKKKMTLKALDETATISTGLTVYEMNRSLVAKEDLFDFDDQDAVNELKNRLWEWFNNDTSDEFYLLYSRDLHYLTMFQIMPRKFEGEERILAALMPGPELDLLMDALKNVGELISIDFNTTEDEAALEIWMRTPLEPAVLMYLFPFDKGVVRVE